MLFNSPIFLFGFLPVTVALYLVVRQLFGPRAVLGLLLCASIFFYGWWNPAYVPLLLGLWMLQERRRGGEAARFSNPARPW